MEQLANYKSTELKNSSLMDLMQVSNLSLFELNNFCDNAGISVITEEVKGLFYSDIYKNDVFLKSGSIGYESEMLCLKSTLNKIYLKLKK